MSKSTMKPSALQKLLTTFIIIALAASGGGFYYAQSKLSETAAQVKTTRTELAISDNLTNEVLRSQVATASISSEKALALKLSAEEYQEQLTSDVKAYARNNSINVSNYSFAANSTDASTTANASSMTITLSNPVNFNDLMKFLKSIETNIPKIQITNLKITHNTNYIDSVLVDPIIVKGYLGN